MNNGRRLYLTTYNGVDVLDHLIKNANLFYRTWKYWHAPVNHALSIAIAVAYGFYLEAAEGNLDEEWKVEPVTFWEFRRTLAIQGLTYQPNKQQFPGDQNLREVTKMSRSARKSVGGVSLDVLKKLTKTTKTRGCGDLDKLCMHVASVKPIKGRVCEWCGETAHHVCTICKDKDGKPVPLHFTRRSKIYMCFWNYHNATCIGLGKSDTTGFMSKKKKDWIEPSKRQLQANKAHIKALKNNNRLR